MRPLLLSRSIAQIYKLFTWLSLDVAAGAIVFMYFLSQEFETPVHWREAIALGLAVWLIYSIDHLLDARGEIEPVSKRRKLHHRHAKVLVFLTILALFFEIWIVTFLSREIIIGGGILVIIATAYLVIVQIKKWARFKEVQIAIGYAGGVSLVPLVNVLEIAPWHWLTSGLLFLTALTNLILFSWYDQEQDRQEGFTSLVLGLGEKKMSFILIVVFILTVFGALALFQIGDSWRLALFFLVAGAVNFCLWKYPNFFNQNNYYRTVGDAVFLLPLIWLL